MPPRSPTLAFDPTLALDHSHFSSFNGVYRHSSMDHYSSTNGKGVRFQEPFSNSSPSFHGRHSIATSHVPLLPAISSASHLPKQSFRISNPAPSVDISAYFEQCRNVNEQLRKAHETDRKAWEIERAALNTRIADLEFKLNKSNGGPRRKSNDSSNISARSFRSDFHVAAISGLYSNETRHYSQTMSNAPLEHFKSENGKHIWEPNSPVPATRVFSHDEDVKHMPSISEDAAVEISPQTTHENKPIPIQEIDESLDGITVKSEGVKSSFSKIMSPIIVASPPRSPSPNRQQPVDVPALRLNASRLLDPFDAKLKKNAGHTPLVYDGQLSTTQSTGGAATPKDEKPIAPAPTARPPLRPSENSQSYFSTNDLHEKLRDDVPEEELGEPEPQFAPEDDIPLSGPLMLDASGRSEASHMFLDKLDSKLEEEVRKSLSNSPALSPARSTQSTRTEDSEMPRLRMKKSTNFGSAYGTKAPGAHGWNS